MFYFAKSLLLVSSIKSISFSSVLSVSYDFWLQSKRIACREFGECLMNIGSQGNFLKIVNIVKGFGIVNKAEIDVFLELSCFFDDPADVGNLISGFSAFSKTSLNIWKFTVHILLKPGLENFEHY
jgi:hypothetical protein